MDELRTLKEFYNTPIEDATKLSRICFGQPQAFKQKVVVTQSKLLVTRHFEMLLCVILGDFDAAFWLAFDEKQW